MSEEIPDPALMEREKELEIEIDCLKKALTIKENEIVQREENINKAEKTLSETKEQVSKATFENKTLQNLIEEYGRKIELMEQAKTQQAAFEEESMDQFELSQKEMDLHDMLEKTKLEKEKAVKIIIHLLGREKIQEMIRTNTQMMNASSSSFFIAQKYGSPGSGSSRSPPRSRSISPDRALAVIDNHFANHCSPIVAPATPSPSGNSGSNSKKKSIPTKAAAKASPSPNKSTPGKNSGSKSSITKEKEVMKQRLDHELIDQLSKMYPSSGSGNGSSPAGAMYTTRNKNANMK